MSTSLSLRLLRLNSARDTCESTHALVTFWGEMPGIWSTPTNSTTLNTMRWVFVVALLTVLALAVSAQEDERVKISMLLERRQALGGGAGKPDTTTATTPASISGYTPPPRSTTPRPTNFKKGSILSLEDVDGYKEAKEFAQSSGVMTLAPAMLVTGALAIVGGAIFL